MDILEYRIIKYFDPVQFILVVVLALIGLLTLFSATYSTERPFSFFFSKQVFGLTSGIAIYLICSLIDYRSLLRWGYFGYIFVIGLLLFTLAKGSIGMGAQRWLNLGFVKLQPSEIAKLLFPTYAAYHLHVDNSQQKNLLVTFLPIIVMLAASFVLILKQPDLGTALIVIFTGLILMWLAGFPKKLFFAGLMIFLITAPLTWHYVLKPYQKNRIAVFLGYGDSHKERYQIEQALIAIGSGGIWGKGFLKGTQNKLKFLPESRTDFIFAVLCEEWGLVGALTIIMLYILLFIRMGYMVLSLYDPVIQLFAIGSVTHIVLSAIINMGMVVGLLPIVGIPLPLMSYGLSNLWITCASFGYFSRITMQQRSLQEYLPTNAR